MGSGGRAVERRTVNRGPFCLVSMPGEVKDPTQGINVQPVVDSLIVEKDNSCVSPSLGCLEETT